MNAILSYKSALEYRDVNVKSKVNTEIPNEMSKHTIKQIIDNMREPKRTRYQELSSNITFG